MRFDCPDLICEPTQKVCGNANTIQRDTFAVNFPRRLLAVACAFAAWGLSACATRPEHTPALDSPHAQLIIRNGTVFDGSGHEPVRGDVAVSNGRVVAVGELKAYSADREIDAHSLAVAQGLINVLSWAVDSLMQDGRGLSDIKQGVTLEIF